jgi:co-chaperonin GroES (HSP10)
VANLSPCGLWHYVELLEAQQDRVTPGGLLLPDSYWPRQDATALVLASGPGLALDGGAVLLPMVEPGDLVLFDYGDFHPLQAEGPGARQGFVWEPRLVGWLACDQEDSARDRIVPLNDWVLIQIDERPKTAGILALTDQTARPMSGIVQEMGPGRLVTRGKHRGQRLPMPDIAGRRVYWGREAEVVCCGRYTLQWVCIRASDLLCSEWCALDLTEADAVPCPHVSSGAVFGAYGSGS